MFTSTPPVPSYMTAGEQNYIPNTGEENAIFTSSNKYGNNGFGDETGPLLPRYHDEGHFNDDEGKKGNKGGNTNTKPKSKKGEKQVAARLTFQTVTSVIVGACAFIAICLLTLALYLKRDPDTVEKNLHSNVKKLESKLQEKVDKALKQAQKDKVAIAHQKAVLDKVRDSLSVPALMEATKAAEEETRKALQKAEAELEKAKKKYDDETKEYKEKYLKLDELKKKSAPDSYHMAQAEKDVKAASEDKTETKQDYEETKKKAEEARQHHEAVKRWIEAAEELQSDEASKLASSY